MIESPFPTSRDDDAEDVAWGLTTGGALWRQGERYDAIIWLKRAVEAATDAGASERADELNRATTELMAVLAKPSGQSLRSPLPPKISSPRPPSPERKASPVPAKPTPSSKPRLPASAIIPEGEAWAMAQESAIARDLSSSPPTPRFPSPLPGSAHNRPPESVRSLVAALESVAELTADQRSDLAATAILERLETDEDVTIGGLALVIEGRAGAQATVADMTAVAVNAGELLYARSSIPDSLSLRLVAETGPTTIAIWEARIADEILAAAPVLLERLKRVSDRIQAIAGCMMGALGEEVDDTVRRVAMSQLVVRVLHPHDLIAEAGRPVPGMVIVGVGSVELTSKNGKGQRLGPGDFLFATEVLGGGLAPTTARAGAKGAIVLYGERAITHELLVTCPPLLEVLAGF